MKKTGQATYTGVGLESGHGLIVKGAYEAVEAGELESALDADCVAASPAEALAVHIGNPTSVKVELNLGAHGNNELAGDNVPGDGSREGRGGSRKGQDELEGLVGHGRLGWRDGVDGVGIELVPLETRGAGRAHVEVLGRA